MKNSSAESVKVDQKAIGLLAYQLWENAGRPPSQDLHFWLAAENQLRAAAQSVPTIPVKLPPAPAKDAAPAKRPSVTRLPSSRLSRA